MVFLHVLFLLSISPVALAAHINLLATSSRQCALFQQPPSTGRTWFLCEGKQFTSPTPDQQLAGTKSSNSMKCTAEMTFEQLCCFDFTNVENLLTRAGAVTLDLAQVDSAVEEPSEGDGAEDPSEGVQGTVLAVGGPFRGGGRAGASG